MSHWKQFDFNDESWLRWSRPGVYAIYGDGQLLYIWQSENIAKRLLSGHKANYAHYSNAIILPWGRFKTVTIKVKRSRRFGDWLTDEARLIRRLSPPGNVRHSPRKWRRANGW